MPLKIKIKKIKEFKTMSQGFNFVIFVLSVVYKGMHLIPEQNLSYTAKMYTSMAESRRSIVTVYM